MIESIKNTGATNPAPYEEDANEAGKKSVRSQMDARRGKWRWILYGCKRVLFKGTVHSILALTSACMQKKRIDSIDPAPEEAAASSVHHTGMNVMAAVKIKRLLKKRRCFRRARVLVSQTRGH